MSSSPKKQLDELLSSMDISPATELPRLLQLLEADIDADGIISLNFPTDLKEQKELAHEWAKITHLNETQMLELVQAIVVVLREKYGL